MVSVQNISKFLGNRELFRDVSFHIHPEDRIGVVGPNGAGKTTLFHILMGEVEPDTGSVTKARNTSVGYLPQQWMPPAQKSVLQHTQEVHAELHAVRSEVERLEAAMRHESDPERVEAMAARHAHLLERLEHLGGYDLEARAQKILAGLGFSQEDLDRPVASLSGGWVMRVELARLLLAEPEILLLDEPTNHLDLESLLWLEDFLKTTRSAVLLISHDRAFLNAVARRILEVENGRVEQYNGNYDTYVEEKARRQEILLASHRNQQERIRQIERFIARNRVRKDRARQVQSRLKMLERMERIQVPDQEATIQFQFPEPDRCGKRVFELQKVHKAYGDHVVYEGVDLVVERGDRIAIMGPNGTGKSTLLKILAGKEAPTQGRRLVGHRVRLGYYAQHVWEELNPDHSVLQEVVSIAGSIPQSQVRALLGCFLFRGDDVEKKVRVLSGGEKARLTLCKLLIQAPNVLLLDEPTNHLDIPSREILEEALDDYPGTLCLISHDRRFINAVASKILVVGPKKLELLPGNADDYERFWKDALPATSRETAGDEGPGQVKAKVDAKERKRLEAQWRNELYRRTKPLKEELERLEEALDQAHRQRDELSEQLADPATYQDAARAAQLQRAYRHCQDEIQRLTKTWEDTALELEEVEERFREEMERLRREVLGQAACEG
ncbi:ATP-binding cassette, subfamily F, member 3 [Desulfacinum hydrothermale DSM 13146]|uniref:ATP-binding cassette, subfamily F, member 3 n=1 Tax=Desulfacinum hydrothermale DSM 13146 TaxID=1121390 RepID=A0A1W1XM52_9BACT|nr:ABC-F family ATP-binding cassette domain-containing protein [Desulfacinum hydrothermale]SMC24608.1 ATP-binding cassette, subfamily F, member 3 [Desulfacinum hydrothermale DSM 13146]